MRSMPAGKRSGRASEDMAINIALILDLDGSACDTRWLNAEIRLLDSDVAGIGVSAAPHDYADGPGHAMQRQRSVHFPLSFGNLLDVGGLEGDLGIPDGIEC